MSVNVLILSRHAELATSRGIDAQHIQIRYMAYTKNENKPWNDMNGTLCAL